jgi:hypothetical protein
MVLGTERPRLQSPHESPQRATLNNVDHGCSDGSGLGPYALLAAPRSTDSSASSLACLHYRHASAIVRIMRREDLGKIAAGVFIFALAVVYVFGPDPRTWPTKFALVGAVIVGVALVAKILHKQAKNPSENAYQNTRFGKWI